MVTALLSVPRVNLGIQHWYFWFFRQSQNSTHNRNNDSSIVQAYVVRWASANSQMTDLGYATMGRSSARHLTI